MSNPSVTITQSQVPGRLTEGDKVEEDSRQIGSRPAKGEKRPIEVALSTENMALGGVNSGRGAGVKKRKKAV